MGKIASEDARSSNHALKFQTSTRAAETSSGAAPDSAPAAFQNAINALQVAAQKRGLRVRFEETPDPDEGFWCEAILASQGGREVVRDEAWASKKKEAKHEAAKACLASMQALPDGNGSVAANSKAGVADGKGGTSWRSQGSHGSANVAPKAWSSSRSANGKVDCHADPYAESWSREASDRWSSGQ